MRISAAAEKESTRRGTLHFSPAAGGNPPLRDKGRAAKCLPPVIESPRWDRGNPLRPKRDRIPAPRLFAFAKSARARNDRAELHFCGAPFPSTVLFSLPAFH